MGASLNTSGIAGTPSSMPQQGAQPSSGGKGGIAGQAPVQNAQVGGSGAFNNPAQQQGQNVFNQASNALTSAFSGTQQGMAYQPERITAGGIARDAMSYGNPFESQVVESTLGDIERARQMQANQIGASATGAKAFGGSRHALMESELGRNSLEQASKAASGLRLGGWQNAQNLASQAAQSNQSAGLMGAQQRLGAASQMGNLANLGFGMGQQAQQMQMGAGNTAFALQQALIDAAKGQYGGYTGAPANSLGYMTSAIGATPNVSSQTQQYTPGLFDYLRLGTSFS